MDGALVNEEHMDIEALLCQSDWVRAVAHRLVADPNEAEDVVQDTWVAALSGGPQSPDAQRSWLRTVVRNCVYLGFRGRRRRRAREVAVARPEAVPTHEETLERLEIQSLLTRIVLELDDAARRVVVLRFFDGLNSTEISQQLGITPSAVRMRLSRALETVRERFEAEYGGDRDSCHAALVAYATSRPAVPTASTDATPTAALARVVPGLLVGAICFFAGFSAARPDGRETMLQEAASPPVEERSTRDALADLQARVQVLEEAFATLESLTPVDAA